MASQLKLVGMAGKALTGAHEGWRRISAFWLEGMKHLPPPIRDLQRTSSRCDHPRSQLHLLASRSGSSSDVDADCVAV
jgi:hypothetical protein